jgi:hypothetical protein
MSQEESIGHIRRIGPIRWAAVHFKIERSAIQPGALSPVRDQLFVRWGPSSAAPPPDVREVSDLAPLSLNPSGLRPREGAWAQNLSELYGRAETSRTSGGRAAR